LCRSFLGLVAGVVPQQELGSQAGNFLSADRTPAKQAGRRIDGVTAIRSRSDLPSVPRVIEHDGMEVDLASRVVCQYESGWPVIMPDAEAKRFQLSNDFICSLKLDYSVEVAVRARLPADKRIDAPQPPSSQIGMPAASRQSTTLTTSEPVIPALDMDSRFYVLLPALHRRRRWWWWWAAWIPAES